MKYPEIRLLDEATIHRIAAGEVVDRPASALKELVENAIDAEATSVRVNIINGGLSLLEVTDDGVGFDKKNLELCLKRHATSKISKIDDLDHIESLGFRGEALSAVSSVSKVEITTHSKKEKKSWTLKANGSSEQIIQPSAHSKGTVIRIVDMFYNVPARKKFIKSAASEARECVKALVELAVSHPEIAFEWYVLNDQGEIKKSNKLRPANISRRFKDLIETDSDSLTVSKLAPAPGVNDLQIVAMKPPYFANNQKSIFLSVNGRSVFDKTLVYSLREAYRGLIEVGRFPAVYISVQVDPAMIDVNIHPQKKEIRWPSGFSLGSLVYKNLRPEFSVRDTTDMPAKAARIFSSNNTETTSFNLEPEKVAHDLFSSVASQTKKAESDDFSNQPNQIYENQFKNENINTETAANSSANDFFFSSLRVVGEVGAAWLVCESQKGLVLIDQHAAHERVNFERMINNPNLIRSKPCLFTVEVSLPDHLVDKKAILIEILEDFKFEFSDSSTDDDTKLELMAVPEADRKIDWADWMSKVFERVSDDLTPEALGAKLKTQIAASVACHGSIRKGQRLTNDEIKALMSDLDVVDWGGFCPHGRPIHHLVSHDDIETFFHRG